MRSFCTPKDPLKSPFTIWNDKDFIDGSNKQKIKIYFYFLASEEILVIELRLLVKSMHKKVLKAS